MSFVRPAGSRLLLLLGKRRGLIPSTITRRDFLLNSSCCIPLEQRFTAVVQHGRYLTTTTAPATGEASSSTKTTTNDDDDKTKKDENKKKKDDSNIFLDNLGTIFLMVIGGIVVWLVRGSYNSSNRTAIRDDIEDHAALDPWEIDDLRLANSELTPEVFRAIMNRARTDFPHGRKATYQEFVKSVRATMVSLKGEVFTIELGHLIDRVVVTALESRKKSQDEEMPLAFWLAFISMAMHSDTSDRIRILYDVMKLSKDTDDERPTSADVIDMVGYLQDSCQLTPDSQVVLGDNNIPVQEYRRGAPHDMLVFDDLDMPCDLEAFADILRSRAVCAWGECHLYKKPTV